MNTLKICTLFMIIGWMACQSAPTTPASTDTLGNQYFGEKIDDQGIQNIQEVLSSLDSQDSVKVKVKGTVAEVCQMKGCWMNVKLDGSTTGEPLFVQFKDYGFFMPKDCSGQEVIMEGIAYKAITPVEELRHFAEDAGKSKAEIEAITTPKEEKKFLASGVILRSNGKQG